MSKQPTVISTFAGCGGSSLGYKWAGYHELLAIDFNDNAVETFKLNFDTPIWNRDIKDCTGQEILDFCNIKKGELDLLDGSPPCQGFSTAGKRNLTDERNDLFKEFVRLITELQPKVFVMENVSGMIKGGYKGKFNEILKTLKDAGYNVKVKLLNTMWYEVPQSRERLIFIGVRNDLNIEPVYPESIGPPISFREATRGLDEYEDRPLTAIIKKIAKQQPQNWNTDDKIYESIKGNKAGAMSLKWAQWDRPIGTITKSEISVTGIVHPDRHRYLNQDELKQLSTFPLDFKFTGRKECAERIGNAVMPRFMYHIAKTIKEQILDKVYG